MIKRNFIATLKNNVIANLVFCSTTKSNCDISNVKVYCDKSKRSGDVSRQVVSAEIIIRDTKPLTDKAKALQQHQLMVKDLDAAERLVHNKVAAMIGFSGFSSVNVMASMSKVGSISPITNVNPIKNVHIKGYQSQLACKLGEILKVIQGDGDELARSSCGKKSLCKLKFALL